MTTVILLLIIVILSFTTLWAFYLIRKNNTPRALTDILKRLESDLARIDPLLRNEFARNREEVQNTAKGGREEQSNSFRNFSDTLQTSFKDTREDLSKSFKSFEDRSSLNLKEFMDLLRQKFADLANQQNLVKSETESKLEKIRETVESNLQKLQEQNAKKLEEIRGTVDEKLQTTLEKRFNESFNVISNRLDAVHQGLGEMNKLAAGVGDLKKVLTNVKTRGNLGEVQLGNILEQIFSPEQYDKNSVVKPGSQERVEYTIKLPGRNSDNKPVLLPIDSKFPNEDYQRLLEVYENLTTVNPKELEDSLKQFESSIKKNARDIRDKYINPPFTTDFAIMFVPTEGLYAEILRRTGLFEHLQREYRVTVVGPTNLVAFLSSLQMGFRTLAIERRSSEVWQILGAVKTQFGDFGKILQKTKKKLQEATNVIEEAETKSRVIGRKLQTVQDLPSEESSSILGKSVELDLDDDIQQATFPEDEREPELPFE